MKVRQTPGTSLISLILLLIFFMASILFVCSASSAFAQSSSDKPMLEDIRAYLQISDNLSTSGQIEYDQIPLLKEAGFEVVVNLAPADEERNASEGFLVTQQGMAYVQIPVSWKDPSKRDLQMFFDVLEANQDRKVFVHCFANMRVSAFVYLYRTLHKGIPEETARTDMEKIWDPASQGQWEQFIVKMQQGG